MAIKYKLYFFTFLLLATFKAQAYDCKITLKKLKFNTDIIDTFFEKKSGTGILPFPQSICFKEGQSYNIFDEDGRQAGQITVQKVWFGPFNELLLLKAPPQSLMKIYAQSAKKHDFHLQNITDYLIRAIFNEDYSILEKNQLGLLTFNYKVTPGYKLRYNFYSYVDSHNKAKKINYSQLLKFYQNKDTYFINISTETPRSPAKYHLPNISMHFKSHPSFESRIYPLNILSRQLRTYQFPKDIDKKNVVLTSYQDYNSLAYNAINALVFYGVKNIYWFDGIATEWLKQQRPRAKTIPKEFLISSQALIPKIKNKSIHVIDVRASAGAIGSIPGSIRIPYRYYSNKDYYNYMMTLPPSMRYVKPPEKILEWSSGINHIDYKPLDKKPVVLVSDNSHDIVPVLLESRNLILKTWQHPSVFILDGGLAEFYNETKWQHPELAPTYLK